MSKINCTFYDAVHISNFDTSHCVYGLQADVRTEIRTVTDDLFGALSERRN